MSRYWVFLDSKVQGPFDIPYLRKVPGFTLLTQVCAEGEQSWRMADDVIYIKSYFLAPPRASSVSLDSGAFLSVSLPTPVMEKAPPETAVEPEPAEPVEPLSPHPATTSKETQGPPALRLFCEVCGYKNPRDVASCMKCGTPLKSPQQPAAAPAEEPGSEAIPASVELPSPPPMEEPPPLSAPPPERRPASPVEIPVTRILILLAIASLLGAGGFMGYRLRQSHRRRPPKAAPAPSPSPPAPAAARPVSLPVRQSTPSRSFPKKTVASLPGIRTPEPAPPSPPSPEPPASQEAAVSYRVIREATPLRQRHSAPLDSPYTEKRRADQGLWSGREDQAVQRVQRFRIYGGQRTLQRNVEILMQILRDREYATAFESGKRIHLYNDLDWTAVQKDGPLYEVRLTFSGGQSPDGLARPPLRFAFDADLERGSVEPGGSEQPRSNAMHGFFDESRIPSEERRAMAKDTEEVVLAAQPEGSPLALDAVTRHFVSTYSTGALARVAAAFNLELVNKKLVHDPGLARAAAEPPKSALNPPVSAPLKTDKKAVVEKKETVQTPSKSGPIDYQMESLGGRERRLSLQAPSRAQPSKLWEILTSYDRLKQFAPDLLLSEREGQDGAAIIVHTVSLTRLFFFVFKVNLHLRIVEHPEQHALEFERIAGEFKSFRGSVEIHPNGSGGSTLQFRLTVTPKGRMPNWVLRDTARRFLIPFMDALRSRAESL